MALDPKMVSILHDISAMLDDGELDRAAWVYEEAEPELRGRLAEAGRLPHLAARLDGLREALKTGPLARARDAFHEVAGRLHDVAA